MRRLLGRLVVASAGLFAASCTQLPDNLFVLLPEADGAASAIEVTTPDGAQTLDQPGQATGVDAGGQPLVAPISLDDDDIRRAFGGAFDATPPELKVFLLYFQTGTSRLTPESEALLPEVLAAYDAADTPIIGVVGHTDRQGSAASNARLGQRRADSIRDILIDRGADPKLIEADSHGEGNPLVPTEDGVAEAKNRRVEITIR